MSTINYNGSTPAYNLETPEIGSLWKKLNLWNNPVNDYLNLNQFNLNISPYNFESVQSALSSDNNSKSLSLSDKLEIDKNIGSFNPVESLDSSITNQMEKFKTDNPGLKNEMLDLIKSNTDNKKINYTGAIQTGVNTAAQLTGNKYIAKGAQIATDVYNAGKDILKNKNLMGAATTALSSALGASDSKFGQVASSVVGNAGNIIDGIKSIKTASNAITDAKKALDAAKAGTDAAKSAQTALNAAKVAKAGNIASLGSAALGVIGDAAFGTPDEYKGEKGNVAAISDMAYDTIMTGISFVPVWGQLAAAGMAVNKFTGLAIKALGGGTDGMCVCAGTKVFKANGEIVNIEDLKQEDGIIGWNLNTKEICPQTIPNIIEPRLKECLEITTKAGYVLKCSIDHPILSDTNHKAKSHKVNGKRIAYREWKFRRADNLKVGDFLGIANNIDYWGEKQINNAYLIGLLIGDGSYTKGNSCRLISADKSTWDYIESNKLGVINHCDDSRPEKYTKEVKTYRIINGMDLMKLSGIAYQSGNNKTLPINIGKYNKNSICNLLAGLYDSDGSISINTEKNNWSITLYQSNKNLLLQVKEQLHKLGIFASINTRKSSTYQYGGKLINSKESYRLEIINASSAIKFALLIPLNIDYKKKNLNSIYNLLKDKPSKEHSELSGAKQFKIISIKHIGLLTVYNLQADNDHTYIANGIITHNTTQDAILGSSFLQATPLGMINGFGGKSTTNWTRDHDVYNKVGNSYNAAQALANEAEPLAGKKYGLFSSGARKKADAKVREAYRQELILRTIGDDAQRDFALLQSMTGVENLKYQNQVNGGYDKTITFSKQGGILFNNDLFNNRIKRAKIIIQKTIIIDNFNDLKDNKFILSENKSEIKQEPKQESKSVIPKGALHARKNNIDNDNITSKGIPVVDNKGNQLAEIERDEIIFRLEITKKLEELLKDNSDKAAIEAGKILTCEILNNTEDNTGLIDKFKKGGQMNLIPDGALHARLHHMDNSEKLTKKGIPVVDNKGNLQAEIERNEIIFKLEVTKKIEEYYKENTDESAIKLGKLLTKEILYNTDDKTGLIND